MFATCVTDTFFPDTARAVVRLLDRLGCTVEFPLGQTCCGQMHFNTGYRRESLPMARGFAEAFGGYEAIVSPSASCTAMVREYHGQLAHEAGLAVAPWATSDPEILRGLVGAGVDAIGTNHPDVLRRLLEVKE